MVYVCCFRGCRSTTSLFRFPSNPLRSRLWLRVLGRQEDDKTTHLRVCSQHFSPECFDNYREIEMGFSTTPRLRDDAMPNMGPGPPPTIFREIATQTEVVYSDVGCQTESRSGREVGCQTKVVGVHVSTQVNKKPERRSKATQASAPNKSIACNTSSIGPPPDIPLASSAPEKRPRYVLDEPSYRPVVSENTISGDRIEIPPHKRRKYIVFEDNLMQLFQRCPVCTRSPAISTRTVGSRLLVHQTCPHCGHELKWASHSNNNEDYIDSLLELLFGHAVEDPEFFQQLLKKVHVPEDQYAQFDRTNKEEAVLMHQSRFRQPQEEKD